MSNWTIAAADDWTGLYLGNKLLEQGHSISLLTAFQKVVVNGRKVNTVEHRWVHPEWIEDQGSLPDDLMDVIWEEDGYDRPPLDDNFPDEE